MVKAFANPAVVFLAAESELFPLPDARASSIEKRATHLYSAPPIALRKSNHRVNSAKYILCHRTRNGK
jgi:hypothetical protein